MASSRRHRLRVRLCHYCQDAPAETTDHIVPRALGGPNAVWNYVGACRDCNNAKGDSWPTCRCPKCKQARWKYNTLVGEGLIIVPEDVA